MVRGRKKLRFIKKLFLFIFVLSQFFTSAFVLSKGSTDTTEISNASFQIHHLVFIFMFMYSMFTFKKGRAELHIFKLKVPGFWFALFIVYTLVGFFAFVPVFGVHLIILNFIYAAAVVIVFYNMYENEDPDAVADVVGAAELSAIIIIVINIISQADSIAKFFALSVAEVSELSGGERASIKVFTGGGQNLESSLMALYSVFLLKKKYGFLIWCVSFVISLLYTSRTGFILNVCVLMWYILFVKRMRAKKLMLIFIPLALIAVFVLMNTPLGAIMANRFFKTGTEAGSVGRLQIWEFAFEVIESYPLGVGCGNAVTALAQMTGRYTDAGTVHNLAGNVHNIYLQYLLEQGIFGLIFILFSIFIVYVREKKKYFLDPFGAFMILYFVQGMTQSKAFDAWMAEILGLYFISLKQKWYVPRKINT